MRRRHASLLPWGLVLSLPSVVQEEVSADENASQIVFNISILFAFIPPIFALAGELPGRARAVSDWRKSAGILAARLAAFSVTCFRGHQDALREAAGSEGQGSDDPGITYSIARRFKSK
jgi:hypothetical protein